MPHTANKTPNKAGKLMLFTLLLLTYGQILAQEPQKDTIYTSSQDIVYDQNRPRPNNNSNVITSFEDLNMPPEMMIHFTQITPENIAALNDELQVTANNEDGVAVILTTRLCFKNNCLVGYIREAPLDKTTQVTVSEYSIKIPIEWVCTPTNKKHRQHYVTTLAAIKMAEDQYKCKDWHIKLQQTQSVATIVSRKR